LSGFGIDAQRATVAGYADRKGLTIVGEYCDEGISAKSLTGRPAAVAALEAVRERNAAGLGGPLHRGGGGYEPGMCGIAGAAGPRSSVQLVEEMCRRK
jgi:Resolvase, N terminal domain